MRQIDGLGATQVELAVLAVRDEIHVVAASPRAVGLVQQPQGVRLRGDDTPRAHPSRGGVGGASAGAKEVSRRKEHHSCARVLVVELRLVVVVDEAADGDGSDRGAGGADKGLCEHRSFWYGTVLLVVD